MKKFFTLLLLIQITRYLPAQEFKYSEVLVVYINSGWNKEKKVPFYTINPDPGINAAADLYKLRSVIELLPPDNEPNYNKKKKERFSSINKDSMIYNYFETESAALNFIISKKWRLISVLPQIVTERSDNTFSNTYSVPKYLFAKQD